MAIMIDPQELLDSEDELRKLPPSIGQPIMPAQQKSIAAPVPSGMSASEQPRASITGMQPIGAAPASPRSITAQPLGDSPSIAFAPPLPVSASQPMLVKPTKQESIAAGKAEFGRGKPMITAAPGLPDFYQQKEEQNQYAQEHPWGSPISAHPGLLGKAGHILASVGNVAGDILAPAATSLIPGTDLNRERQSTENQAGETQAEENRLREIQGNVAEESNEQVPIQLPGQPEPVMVPRKDAERLVQAVQGNETRQGIATEGNETREDIAAQGNQTRQNIAAAKTQTFASPFEAFAYGTPQEKQAATDFLSLEKRLGHENDKPGEIEERYSLYKSYPEAYKAMFGDRGGAQDSAQATRDQAQAARMLNYFAKQRKNIEDDFTLDDQTKQQRLSEIDALEEPYLAVAQPNGNQPPANAGGNGSGNGPRPDEVAVISPTGERGYLPKKNLAKALKRGFKQVAQ